jgi:hypothetical protein
MVGMVAFAPFEQRRIGGGEKVVVSSGETNEAERSLMGGFKRERNFGLVL